MPEQPNIVQPEFGYAVWIPNKTPQGRPVTIEMDERAGVHKMHAESPDQSELYFEVTAYLEQLDHQAYAKRQRGFLRDASPNGRLSPLAVKQVGRYTGISFDFQGQLDGIWKERRFLIVDDSQRTYRIVHDYRSTLNEQVLDTLTLLGLEEDDAG